MDTEDDDVPLMMPEYSNITLSYIPLTAMTGVQEFHAPVQNDLLITTT